MNILGVRTVCVVKRNNPISLYSIRRELSAYTQYREIRQEHVDWVNIYDDFLKSNDNYLIVVSDTLMMAPLSLFTIYMSYFPIYEMNNKAYRSPSNDASYVMLFQENYDDEVEIENVGVMISKAYAVKLRNQYGQWNILKRRSLARFNHTFNDIASQSGSHNNFLKYGVAPWRTWFVPEGIKAIKPNNYVIALSTVLLSVYFPKPWFIYEEDGVKDNVKMEILESGKKYFGRLWNVTEQHLKKGDLNSADLVVVNNRLGCMMDYEMQRIQWNENLSKNRVLVMVNTFYDVPVAIHLHHSFIDAFVECGFTPVNYQVLVDLGTNL
jgi:hypothetical protein